MLLNFITIAYRNLFRHKMFSFINIVGLALGIAASLLLLQYVSNELSYDKFHVMAENIYRLRHDAYKGGALEHSEALTYYGAAPAIKESFPEVVNFVRLHRADGMLNYHTKTGDVVSHHETKAFYADSSFFSIFSFPLVIGNANKVLRNPSSLVISESAAKRYFGHENPIGKTMFLSTEWQGGQYIVEGVFKDVPENSHIKFEFLFAIENLLHNHQFQNGAWYWSNFYSYLVLKPGTDPSEFEHKLLSIIDSHLGNYLSRINSHEEFILQPLEKIHLHSNIRDEAEVNNDYKIISFLMLIAFLIIGIAWLNYINLSTAKAMERAREVGMRKVLGSNRNQLIKQFLIESLALTLIAIIIAAILLVVSRQWFNGLIGKEITLDLTEQTSFWIASFGIMMVGTLLSGLYPAFVISSLNPLISIKGKFIRSIGSIGLRKAIVIFQFSASIFLIISTIIIYRQLDFMKSQDLGMNINKKVVLRAPQIIHGDSYLNAMDYFKNKVNQFPEVSYVTASSEVPGKEIFWANEFSLKSEPENTRRMIHVLAVDEDFIPAYDFQIIAGRNFSKERQSDYGGTVIMNEAAVKLLGIKHPDDAIGQELISDAGFMRIIGVLKNFHQQSLNQPIDPIMVQYIPWKQSYLTLSINSTNIRQTMVSIENTFHNVFPENAFEYFFLDDRFDHQYKSDERSWKIFILFSALSIIIACLGLFGLSLFTTIQRSKEIAIRKVLGASVATITLLLSKDFIKLVVIAFILTAPLSWFLLNQWLQNFAYRINIPLWTFAVSGTLVTLIAFFAVGLQSIKAALSNPVESIKIE